MDDKNDENDSGFLSYVYGMMGMTLAQTNEDDDTAIQKFSSYKQLDKEAVLKEALIFDDPDIVRQNPSRCRTVILKLIWADPQQSLTQDEATRLFFGLTKLFASNDQHLRRLQYIILKDLMEICEGDDLIFATNALLKDMTAPPEFYPFCGHALLVLSRILDPAMLSSIRTAVIKRNIVNASTHPGAASCALVTLSHFLTQYDSSFLKSWAKGPRPQVRLYAEIFRLLEKSALAANSPKARMVQFHAVQLLCQMTEGEKAKLQFDLCKVLMCIFHILAPVARVVVMRYTAIVLVHNETAATRPSKGQDGSSADDSSPLHDQIQACCSFLLTAMRNDGSSMVVHEAARAICLLPGTLRQDDSTHSAALAVLCQLSEADQPSARRAGKRTLAQVANDRVPDEPLG